MKLPVFFKFPQSLIIFIPVSVFLKLLHFNDTLVFLSSALSIIPLADLLGKATEMLAAKTSPTLGGFLNASLGNLAELVIGFFAIAKGYTDLVKASITGSIIGNLLFVLGLSVFVGGLKYKSLKFNRITAESGTAMLFLSVASLLVPSLFVRAGGIDHLKTVNNVSLFIAIVLIITYFLSLVFIFKTHKNIFMNSNLIEKHIDVWPLKKSITLLIISGVLIAIMSELLVSSIEVTIKTLNLSETFIGLIVVALIGNAAEHITAVFFAYKNKMDLALQISLGSSVQIALFVAPILVFVSFISGNPMSLVFTMMEVIAVALATGIIGILSLDGKSNWFEGCQLLALYIILAVAFYFY